MSGATPSRLRHAVLLGPLAFLLSPGPALPQTELSRGVAIDRDAYVKVYLLDGAVRVTGWDRDSLAVIGTVERGRPFFGGSGKSAKLGVWEDDPAAAGEARLEVRVPRGATIWIKSRAARVTVTGMSGGVDVYSVTGDVRVEGSLRQLYAESMSGEVTVTASAPSIRLKTASGDIAYRGRGEDLTLATVSGGIDAAAEHPLRAHLETVTGDVRWSGGVGRGGSLSVQTHSGRVELRLPARLDADVAVATIEGVIRNEVGPSSKPRPRELKGRELSFLSGAGGAQVVVRTFSGDVALLPR